MESEAKKFFENHQENRKVVLLKIYELAKGSIERNVGFKDAFEKLAELSDSANDVKNYLLNEGLITMVNKEDRTMRITHDGIKAVELYFTLKDETKKDERINMVTLVKNKFWIL